MPSNPSNLNKINLCGPRTTERLMQKVDLQFRTKISLMLDLEPRSKERRVGKESPSNPSKQNKNNLCGPRTTERLMQKVDLQFRSKISLMLDLEPILTMPA